MSGDSPELEALFDEVANQQPQPAAAAAPETGDTPELEALFDSISDAQAPLVHENEPTPTIETLFDDIAAAVSRDEAKSTTGEVDDTRVFEQVGHMTRSLHNLLRELGYEKTLGAITQDLPDTRERLNYIAAMTSQAAERTLAAAEAIQPIHAQLGNQAQDLAAKWERLFNKQMGVDDFKAMVTDTRSFLGGLSSQTNAANEHLVQIILAQEFQDLTGQVIKKVLAAAQNLEQQLITLLLETTPEDRRQGVRASLLEGPIVNAADRSDIVTNQEQVDELLESLGF